MPDQSINLGTTSRPCWLEEKLERATITNCRVLDGFVYFDIEGFKLTYRVPLEHPGMPQHVYAPDGTTVTDRAEIFIGKCPDWGYEIYWLVFDIEWFRTLPVKHDGLSRTCPLCQDIQ
jgi:hypothetical protein